MRTNRWSKGLAATIAAVAVSALCAGSALAAPAVFNDVVPPSPPPYEWNGDDPLQWGIEGTVKVALGANYYTETRCTSAHLTQPMGSTWTFNSGSPLQGSTRGGIGIHAFCPMGFPNYFGTVLIQLGGPFAAEQSGGAFSLTSSGPVLVMVQSNQSAGPQWMNDPAYVLGPYSGTWTNGTSAANPSRLTFNATTIGKHNASAQPVKLTATFTARNPSNPNGQLVTLN